MLEDFFKKKKKIVSAQRAGKIKSLIKIGGFNILFKKEFYLKCRRLRREISQQWKR
jgi:hypothetical protein